MSRASRRGVLRGKGEEALEGESRKRYNYIKKRLAVGTRESILFSLIAFCFMTAGAAFSVRAQGQASSLVGALGISGMLFFIAGFFYAVTANARKNDNRIPARILLFADGFFLLLCLALLFVGMKKTG